MASALVDQYRDTLDSDRRHLFDRYRYVHAARKVVGVAASAPGLVALFVGRDEDDPLFLQIKEAQPRCWSPTRRRPSSPTRASEWSRASG